MVDADNFKVYLRGFKDNLNITSSMKGIMSTIIKIFSFINDSEDFLTNERIDSYFKIFTIR